MKEITRCQFNRQRVYLFCFKGQRPSGTGMDTSGKKSCLNPADAAIALDNGSLIRAEGNHTEAASGFTGTASDTAAFVRKHQAVTGKLKTAGGAGPDAGTAVDTVDKLIVQSASTLGRSNAAQGILAQIRTNIILIEAGHLTSTAACACFGIIADFHFTASFSTRQRIQR